MKSNGADHQGELMSRHSLLDRLIGDIAARSGLPLKLDENGSCAIACGGELEIVLTAVDQGNTVLLHSPLQFLSLAEPLAHLRHCMALNLYGTQTGGATLSLDPDSEWITLWRRMRLDAVEAQELEAAILAFAATAEDLRARLSPAALPKGAGQAALRPEPDVVLFRL